MNYLIFDTVHCVIVTMHSQNIGTIQICSQISQSILSQQVYPTAWFCVLEMKTLVDVNYEGVIDLSMQTVNDAGQPWNGPGESKITLVMFLYAIIVGSSEH